MMKYAAYEIGNSFIYEKTFDSIWYTFLKNIVPNVLSGWERSRTSADINANQRCMILSDCPFDLLCCQLCIRFTSHIVSFKSVSPPPPFIFAFLPLLLPIPPITLIYLLPLFFSFVLPFSPTATLRATHSSPSSPPFISVFLPLLTPTLDIQFFNSAFHFIFSFSSSSSLSYPLSPTTSFKASVFFLFAFSCVFHHFFP